MLRISFLTAWIDQGDQGLALGQNRRAKEFLDRCDCERGAEIDEEKKGKKRRRDDFWPKKSNEKKSFFSRS